MFLLRLITAVAFESFQKFARTERVAVGLPPPATVGHLLAVVPSHLCVAAVLPALVLQGPGEGRVRVKIMGLIIIRTD
jgi:hypothetical protein